MEQDICVALLYLYTFGNMLLVPSMFAQFLTVLLWLHDVYAAFGSIFGLSSVIEFARLVSRGAQLSQSFVRLASN